MRRALSPSLAVVGLAFVALCAPSLMASQSAGWSVVVASNAFVEHGEGAAGSAISTGASVATGDRLTTGAGGALVLTRGQDLVTMAENSRIEIVDPQPSTTTLIAQPYGHVDYQVTKEKVPHFEVDSPLLATVVKGTTFTVDANRAKSSVTVTEGRVLAKNRSTGASASVGAGQQGAVASGGRGVDVGAASSKGGAVNSESTDASDSTSESGNGSSGNNGNGNGKDKDKSSGNSGNGNGNGHGNSGGNSGGNGGNGGGNDGGNGYGKGKGKNK